MTSLKCDHLFQVFPAVHTLKTISFFHNGGIFTTIQLQQLLHEMQMGHLPDHSSMEMYKGENWFYIDICHGIHEDFRSVQLLCMCYLLRSVVSWTIPSYYVWFSVMKVRLILWTTDVRSKKDCFGTAGGFGFKVVALAVFCLEFVAVHCKSAVNFVC